MARDDNAVGEGVGFRWKDKVGVGERIDVVGSKWVPEL